MRLNHCLVKERHMLGKDLELYHHGTFAGHGNPVDCQVYAKTKTKCKLA